MKKKLPLNLFCFVAILSLAVPILLGVNASSVKAEVAEYESLQYFKTTEGQGIEYHITDNYQPLDCNVWAVSQYFETGKPHSLDFVFTLIKEGNAGGYFRNSCIGGLVSLTISGRELSCFYRGYPVGNQAHFYYNFSLPRYFDSGDEWNVGNKNYKVEYVGSQIVNGIGFSDCIKINIDDSQNAHEYLRGTGYFILARNIGIVKLVFNRTNGTNVLYEYLSHNQLTRHTISGTINKRGVPVEGIIVQIANANWGNRSVTDSNGAFSVQAYGPDIVLRIGNDKDYDDIFDFDDPNYPFEYWANNITSDISGIIIEIYYTNAHSVHFESGRYIVELRVDDPNDTIQSISAIGPGIAGSISLSKGLDPFHPYIWWSRPNVSLGTTPPPLPLVYTFTIKDKTGATYIITDAVQSYVEDFATNLSPSNNEIVTGQLVFSWTGIDLPEVRYKIELSDDQGNRIWDSSSNITNTYYVYDGPAFSPGSYQYYVVSWSKYGDSSLAYATFCVGSNQPEFRGPWKGIARITQGNRAPHIPSYSHYDHGNWDNTYAIDVALPVGSDVLAPADGLVTWYDDDPSGSGGKELAIEHIGQTGKRFTTVYLHLNEIIIKSGAVTRGQTVAKSGDTGIVSGPHLHFHIWSEVEPRDSHTLPIERLVMKEVGVDFDFRVYDARKGDLDNVRIEDRWFESDNIPLAKLGWVQAEVLSPVELRVYDSVGRVTGIMGGEEKNEIPNSAFYDDYVLIASPVDSYRYEVVGTGEGSYSLILTKGTEQDVSTFMAADIPISTEATHEYTVDWEALAHGQEGVTAQIDSDGDGVFEMTITSDNELTRDEFISAAPPPPVEVGGEVYPINKVSVLVPWIALSATIIVGVIIAMNRRSVRN